MTSDLEDTPLKERTAWIFSDGKAGHESQSLGVAEALGVNVELKRVKPGGIFRLISPWGPVSPGERFGEVGSATAPPWPAVAIATGRTTIPYLRALKRRAGSQTFAVALMDPRVSTGVADLVWVPEHDRRRGANVITTLTAPHRFSATKLSALRAIVPPEIAALPRPRIACLIGGPNSEYRYTSDDERRLISRLASLAESGGSLMITPSRRTPPALASALESAGKRSNVIFWNGTGPNPYADFLANADLFVITADSVSMTCEAAATGRPIYVFEPAGGGGKFRRFHDALAAYGATRPLPDGDRPLDVWTYEPIDSARRIADEINSRWQRTATALG
jgi:mitochondrial fission protein ELM1